MGNVAQDQVALKPESVAEMLQIHPNTVRVWASQGRLKGRKVGARWLISAQSIQDFFEEHQSQ